MTAPGLNPPAPASSENGAGFAVASQPAQLCAPEQWVDEYGDYLYRFALVRVRDESLAEDLVQETFLAVLKNPDRFGGRSNPKSWLVGILKNKVIDYFRKASRETSFTDLEFNRDEQSDRFVADGLFKDGWIHELGPQEWDPSPAIELDNEAFWAAFNECSSKLPKNIARVFLLREMDQIPGDEVCELMNITPNNLWVMLHRARMALRRCLEVNWIAKNGGCS